MSREQGEPWRIRIRIGIGRDEQGAERTREDQRGSERIREDQRGPERTREDQRGSERI